MITAYNFTIIVEYKNGYYEFVEWNKNIKKTMQLYKKKFKNQVILFVIFHEWDHEINLAELKRTGNKPDHYIYTSLSILDNFCRIQKNINKIHRNNFNSRFFISSKGFLNQDYYHNH